jgi:hypothetical protein
MTQSHNITCFGPQDTITRPEKQIVFNLATLKNFHILDFEFKLFDMQKKIEAMWVVRKH